MLGVLLLALGCVGALERKVVVDHGAEVPATWVEVDGAIDATRSVDLTFALKRRNVKELEKIFWEVSNPQHPRYGKYLSSDEFIQLLAPRQETIDSVFKWLAGHEVTNAKLDAQRDYITATVPVRVAEELLSLKFSTYQSTETKQTLIRAVGPIKVPESMALALDTILGASGFPVQRSVVSERVEANIEVTPKVLIERYNVSTDANINKNNLQAVAEFQGQYISQTDVCTFYKDFGLNGTCTIHRYIGKNNPNQPGVESSLDVDYIQGLADDVPLDYYIYPGMDFCSDLTTWTSGILATDPPGWVHSVSYGVQKYKPLCSSEVRSRLDQDFQKLATKGVSVLFASGDSGSGWYGRQGYNDGHLTPSWPAESPYVTAVGSTYFYEGKENVEGATTQFGSGGGFSFNEDMPSFQETAVKAFIAAYPSLPPASQWNKNGRGTPDVAALGEQFTIVMNGRQMKGVGGTSASTPSFAGIVSRLNNIRLAAGKPSMGNLNQFLYQNPHAFYDVTIGSNKIGQNRDHGWDCVKGWDPVTGLGTPNYQLLKAAAQALP